MKNFKPLAVLFTRDTKGAVMPLIGLSIALLIAFMGVAIDSGRYFLVRNKLLSALDSALIASADIATKSLNERDPTAIAERGKEFFEANFPVNYLGTTVGADDLDIQFDPATGTVTGNVNAELPLVFGGIYSDVANRATRPSFDIEVFSEVRRTVGNRTLEIAIAVDHSFSMCYKLGTGRAWGIDKETDPACAKFATVQASVNQLVSTVRDAVAASDNPLAAFYSYIPFSHEVQIDGSLSNFNFFNLDGLDNEARIESALGLTTDAEEIIQKVDSTELSLESGTNTAMGIWWAWASLRPDQNNLFTGSSQHENPAEHPANLDQVRAGLTNKVIVVLTDGENEYSNFRSDRLRLSGDKDGVHPDTNANAQLNQFCDQIKAESTYLCTISFNVPSSSSIVGRLQQCASPGCSYNATDSEQLEKAFDDIANRLIDKQITQ